MDFMSTALITMSAPSGFWPTILNWFKGANGTYILAVVLVAICVRVIFAFVDIINKRANMKNSDINAKMQPELEAIKQKYGKDQALMQQKTNEVYKKYQYNMMGSCLPMLLMMVLQMVVFLTLWNSLQSVSNYNIVSQYQEMKEIYANVINLNTNDNFVTNLEEIVNFTVEDTITITIVEDEENNKTIEVDYTYDGGTRGHYSAEYEDFAFSGEEFSNQKVNELIEKYVFIEQESSESEANTSTQTVVQKAIQQAAEKAVAEYYINTQEGFLWIKNVYKSDSTTSPLFTEKEIKNYISSYYSDEEKTLEDENDYEGTIYTCVVAGIDTESLGSNGYYILPIIAILVCVISVWLNNFLMRRKDQPQKKQSWAMYVVTPLIYAIFTFTYTSLFSVYLIVGQFMMMIISPLTTLIVRKWMEHDENKKKEKTVIEVDYRRKDM